MPQDDLPGAGRAEASSFATERNPRLRLIIPLIVAIGFLMEWLAARFTGTYFTVSEAEARDARRLHIHRGAIAIGNGRDPVRFGQARRDGRC